MSKAEKYVFPREPDKITGYVVGKQDVVIKSDDAGERMVAEKKANKSHGIRGNRGNSFHEFIYKEDLRIIRKERADIRFIAGILTFTILLI